MYSKIGFSFDCSMLWNDQVLFRITIMNFLQENTSLQLCQVTRDQSKHFLVALCLFDHILQASKSGTFYAWFLTSRGIMDTVNDAMPSLITEPEHQKYIRYKVVLPGLLKVCWMEPYCYPITALGTRHPLNHASWLEQIQCHKIIVLH